MKQQVLILHQDTELCSSLKEKLLVAAIESKIVHDLDDAIRLFIRHSFCLVIMDATISEIDGQHLLKIMRTIKPVPILLLAADEQGKDKLAALEAGATAYIRQPYRIEECIAQAKALIDFYTDIRHHNNETHTLAYGTSLIIVPTKRQVFAKELPVQLTRKEFNLLLLLAGHPGHVFTREQIYQQVWGTDHVFNVDEVVKAHIKTLRKKLSETETDHIQNVWGVGYCFSPK